MQRSQATVIWILGALGWFVSWGFFAKWLAANDWDFFGGWAEAFTASDFATGLLLDLVLVTLMMVALAIYDRARIGPKWAIAVIATLSLSVSVSLAVYLTGVWRSRAVAQT